MNYLFLFLF
ncbi:Protein CBG25904 [Caenorhabditis briggsae]|uniref:Protein CBG25904 n=1 Tax=Caenorhabditis briggsae TaxID=6238 RepID=B6IHL4_CAEBR|nr:Protein CBG25904 [Caenorhabditis briggsae]CAR99415.1 Protein CBG25904 [Caenorhabditis briggsae]